MYFFEARSPVFSHLSSTLQGLSTIRAFKAQQSFQQMFDEYQDLHSGENKKIHIKYEIHIKYAALFLRFSLFIRAGQCNVPYFLISLISRQLGYHVLSMCLLTEAWFLFLTTSRWLAVRLDGICSVFVTITAFGCLYFRDGTVWSLNQT